MWGAIFAMVLRCESQGIDLAGVNCLWEGRSAFVDFYHFVFFIMLREWKSRILWLIGVWFGSHRAHHYNSHNLLIFKHSGIRKRKSRKY